VTRARISHASESKAFLGITSEGALGLGAGNDLVAVAEVKSQVG